MFIVYNIKKKQQNENLAYKGKKDPTSYIFGPPAPSSICELSALRFLRISNFKWLAVIICASQPSGHSRLTLRLNITN